ncbi:hypothetical protein BV898_18754 [Hypsibius exemplaris]|uniref:Uncharacterized protein n=1 Tax=Hypsibius exemplaris TaxID=2072580 RepID=A0A9X6NK79_HYPEX|nr:hypothetical protein BV898_18754 [Hypsibius exemplaris]
MPWGPRVLSASSWRNVTVPSLLPPPLDSMVAVMQILFSGLRISGSDIAGTAALLLLLPRLLLQWQKTAHRCNTTGTIHRGMRSQSRRRQQQRHAETEETGKKEKAQKGERRQKQQQHIIARQTSEGERRTTR